LSVGEVISAAPLVQRLREVHPGRPLVFSASTRTGFEIARRRFQTVADEVCFFPYDLPFSVRRIAGKIDPSLVVIVETDLWPNFLREMKRRRVPVVLVNARLSLKSFQGYGRFSFFIKPLLAMFSRICVQSERDRRRFLALGAPGETVRLTGNLKFDQPHEPMDPREIASTRRSLNIGPGRRILLAGSTHEGEEKIILEAFSRLRNEHDDLLLVVAPRNPDRSESVRRLFSDAGFPAATLGDLKRPGAESRAHAAPDVIVIDVIGILKRLYALSDIAIVGGSLGKTGGHNPLEPAAFSRPILFGPDMSNFSDISRMLLEAGGAVRVKDSDAIHRTVRGILADSDRAAAMGEKAFAVFTENQGAVEKTVGVILGVEESDLK
ncbi:MAG: 3-deoxy-D-manno-octulosonic acid transferase, partial [Desulfobacterales bacterium]|nr:3-deoxy-D-manno-octulosonic acid transferase [Desulfobacterales bacterium]